MGDMGEVFQAMKEHKSEVRALIEPNRFKYALEVLGDMKLDILTNSEKMQITIPKGQIDFWPFTGWYCGRKPLWHIKGRGISNLIKEIRRIA